MLAYLEIQWVLKFTYRRKYVGSKVYRILLIVFFKATYIFNHNVEAMNHNSHITVFMSLHTGVNIIKLSK